MGKTGPFSSVSLVPEFGRRLRHHWASAVMGGTVPGIGLFVWSLFGSVPHWTVGLTLVGALLFSGYFTWRDEYLARQKVTQQIRVKVDSAIEVTGGTWNNEGNQIDHSVGMIVKLTVFNAGKKTILDDWTLTLPNGKEVLAFKDEMLDRVINPSPKHRSEEEFALIQNVQAISQNPLDTGDRKKLFLEFTSRGLSQAEFEEVNKDDRRWALKFRNTSGAWHIVNLVRIADIFKAADDLDEV